MNAFLMAGRNEKRFCSKFSAGRCLNLLMAALLAFLIISCREECRYKPRSLALVNFHSIVEGNDQQTPLDSLSISGIGREDSLLYSVRNNIRSVTLPINGSAGESAFILETSRGTDTLWLSYKVIPLFLSPECGFVLNFELIRAWHTDNMIDSVVIVTKEITSFDDTNIRIYH